MNKTVGFFAGLIGGSFGLIASLLVFIFEFNNISEVTMSVWLGGLFSILAITGAIVVQSKEAVGGGILIIASVGVFVTVSMFNIVSAMLILIGGLMGVTKANQRNES